VTRISEGHFDEVDDELWSLTEAMCDGTIHAEQKERLEALLRSGEDARLFYAAYMDLHGRMLWRFRGSGYGLPSNLKDGVANSLLPDVATPIGPLQRGVRGRIGMLFSKRSRRTVMGALGLVMTLGAMIFLVIHLVQDYSAKRHLVARVTGMVDCYWAEGSQPLDVHEYVGLGRQLHLEEGLLEITYRTGATVILQGPVCYQVDSCNGGFISMGKLSGKATSSKARGFTVRTATATVMDLGTEFGVEVMPDGAVETQVFSGKVKLAASTSPGQTPSEIVLNSGQAAQVVHKDGDDADAANAASLMIQVVSVTDTDRIIRAMPPVQSDILISPTRCNGSFETPAIGLHAQDGKGLPQGVAAKRRDVHPRYWNPMSLVRPKGAEVHGATGNQYVVLENSQSVLSTQFDGKQGHPATRTYDANTTYVLTADLGSSDRDAEGVVGFAFEGATRRCEQSVRVTEPNAMKPMPALKLNTSEHPEFVGKLVTVHFMKTKGRQLYVDNVMLRALPSPSARP